MVGRLWQKVLGQRFYPVYEHEESTWKGIAKRSSVFYEISISQSLKKCMRCLEKNLLCWIIKIWYFSYENNKEEIEFRSLQKKPFIVNNI